MKKLSVLFLTMLICVFSYSQWTSYTTNLFDPLYSVFFTSSTTGYVAGGSGNPVILKTTDKGVSWNALTVPTKTRLFSICFTDSLNGYAGGYGTIIKTTDGGKTWNSLTGNFIMPVKSIYFTDVNTGYAAVNNSSVSSGSQLFKTTDAGITWSMIAEINCFTFSSIFFTNANTGYAAGFSTCNVKGNIMKTEDGGKTWTTIFNNTYTPLLTIQFTDSNNGFAAGGYSAGSNLGGNIFRTTDAGKTWIVNSGTIQYINSLSFLDSKNGYAVGSKGSNYSFSGLILKTTDGGISWSDITKGTYNELNSVYAVDINSCFIAGLNGTILKTTNGGGMVSGAEVLESGGEFKVYPNPANHKIKIELAGNRQAEITVHIYNLNGVLLLMKLFSFQSSLEMDVSSLAKGMYIIELQSSGTTESCRLVVD